MRVWRKDIDTAAFLVYIDKCALYYKKDREIEEVKENKLLTVLSHGMECQDVKEHGRPHQLAKNFESGAYSHFLIIHVSKISWPIKTDVSLFFPIRLSAICCVLYAENWYRHLRYNNDQWCRQKHDWHHLRRCYSIVIMNFVYSLV